MDDLIRNAAFHWLKTQTGLQSEVLPRGLLENGFKFQSQRIPLIGPQGIWKPQAMELPISITSIHDGQYPDMVKGGLIHYSYRGTDPNHPANVGLRNTMLGKRPKPLIYFTRILPGKYVANWPVYVIKDDPGNLIFTAAIDDINYLNQPNINKIAEDHEDYARREYITTVALRRMHQHKFREQVIHAYRNQCALCKLRHTELLDAAHIIPDKLDGGEPIIPNGLSLCKIHHAAFDKYILGITPDYVIKIRGDILEEIDGPMLKYGLQSLENSKIILPFHMQDRPDRERLDKRYQEFLDAS